MFTSAQQRPSWLIDDSMLINKSAWFNARRGTLKTKTLQSVFVPRCDYSRVERLVHLKHK